MKNKRIALIDADSLLYYEMNKPTLEEAIAGVDDRIETILKETDADMYAGFLTIGKCFRYRVAKSKPYKHNRKVGNKPPIFYALKEYIKQAWNFTWVHGLEADDCVSLYANNMEKGYSPTICSPDKDVLKQVPGKHFNFQKAIWIDTSKEKGLEFLWMQTLMGDSTDGIPGIPGLGEKTAEKIIKSNDGSTSYAQDVLKIYIEKFGNAEGISKFTETFNLVYMLRSPEEVLKYTGNPLPELEVFNAKKTEDESIV
tara:strand:- start:1653 stop:2417 length:765 start_codon:yes stop_codon:yes gene_type:complete